MVKSHSIFFDICGKYSFWFHLMSWTSYAWNSVHDIICLRSFVLFHMLQVYMYSVWYGYLLSLILFTMIWKLFMNYLHAKWVSLTKYIFCISIYFVLKYYMYIVMKSVLFLPTSQKIVWWIGYDVLQSLLSFHQFYCTDLSMVIFSEALPDIWDSQMN